MGGVVKILTSPLSLISKKLGKVVQAGALIAAGVVTGQPGLIAAGISMGASALSKRPKAPQVSPESIDRLNASIDPRTPRKMVFGRTAMATDIRDQEYTDSQTYLHRFIVVAAHKVQAIEEIWFDDKKVWTVSGGVQGEYVGYLTVTPILEGSAGNAINISARMGATRRFTGLAYVHLRYKLTGNSKKTDSPFAQGISTRITIRGKGAFIYDPRLDSTVPGGSGSHRADDQSTWAWNDSASRNPALQKLWYMLGWRIAGKLSVGRGIPPARIDLESYAIAANLCDEAVNLAAGGTEPRYRSDGVFSEGDSPTSIIDNFKAAMNADLDDVGGKLRLTVFHNDLADPVAAFDDDDMIEAYRWKQTPSLVDGFNIVRGSYTDPRDASLYQMVDYPQVEMDSPDGIDRIDSFDLALVQSPSQAQRLAKQRLQRQQYGGEFQTVWGSRGWRVQKNSVVTQTVSALGWVNKLFRVAEMEHRVDGTCPVILREENEGIYAWDEDESPAVESADPTVYDFTKSPIYLGFDDIDQSGTKVVWKRSATQPATPADSPGTPATWYDDVASVPAGANPLWAMQGQRGDVTLDYVWDTPYQAEAVQLHTWYAYADAPDGSFNFTTGAPGSRTYQGIATGKTTATESTDPADYVWSPYVGPPNFGLANFNSNTVLAGNKLIKVAGGADWNASVHSTESFKGGASVSFVVDDVTKSFMVGLSSDPTTDASYTSIDFAIQCFPDLGSDIGVYEDGNFVTSMGTPYTAGDVFSATYNDKSVVYSKNGIPFHINSGVPSGLTLFFDSSLNTPGQSGRILSFNAAGTAGDDGNDGISPVSAVAIPLNKQFTADSDGTVKAGQLPFNVAISGTKAGASIGGTVSIGTPSGCTATAISGGFTIDTVSADAGFVPWTFTATDGQVVEGKVSFSRQRDPASGGQVSVNFSSTSWWGSGSYGSSGPSTVLPASSTGKLAISGFASFYCSGNGEARLTAKLQYRAVGSGTWIDAGFSSGPGIAIKTADMPGEPGENTPGEVNPTGTLTGLTANGSYEVQMVGSRNASYNAIAAATGFITLAQVL